MYEEVCNYIQDYILPQFCGSERSHPIHDLESEEFEHEFKLMP